MLGSSNSIFFELKQDMDEIISDFIYSMIQHIIVQILVDTKKIIIEDPRDRIDCDPYWIATDNFRFEIYEKLLHEVWDEIDPTIQEICIKMYDKIQPKILTHTTEEY